VRLAASEVARDHQSRRGASVRGIFGQPSELATKPRLHLRLVRSQQAHSVPIRNARAQRLDRSSCLDLVNFHRGCNRSEIDYASGLRWLVHAAAAMRARDENGFSRFRS